VPLKSFFKHFIKQTVNGSLLYHLAQQKFCYKIVKNRSRNTQKRLYFDLKITNFLQWLPVAFGNWGSAAGLSAFVSWGIFPKTSHGLQRLGPPDPCWVIQTFPF